MTIWFHGVVDDSLNVQGFLSCLNASIQFMRIIIISWIVLTGILCHRWTLMHPWIENERSTSITERDTPHTGRSCLGRSASDGCRRSGGTESLGWCSYWCNHPADRSQCLAPTGGGSGWRGTTYPDWSVPCIDELPSAVSLQVLALLALFFQASQDLEKRVEASHHHPTAVPTYVTKRQQLVSLRHLSSLARTILLIHVVLTLFKLHVKVVDLFCWESRLEPCFQNSTSVFLCALHSNCGGTKEGATPFSFPCKEVKG